MWTARDATSADIPRLTELLRQLYELEPQFTPDPEKQRKGLELSLEKRELCRLVVVQNSSGEAIGLANLQYKTSTAHGAMSVHIDDFIVDVAHRGQGAGKTLMEAVWRAAEDIGAVRVTINVDVENAPALAFYEKQGYTSLNLMRYQRFIK